MTEVAPSAAIGGALGIVVVNFASHMLLSRNLAPLDLHGPEFEVVVVDNRSSSAESAAIRVLSRANGWHLVQQEDNPGFGAGANCGAAKAAALGCAAYLFLNPDAVITRDLAAELRTSAIGRPAAMFSPVLFDSAGEVFFQGAEIDLLTGHLRGSRQDDDGAGPRPRTQEWLSGACLAVSRAFFEQLDGFDESYFLYWEDVDLSHRALALGGELVVRRDLSAWHDEGGTQSRTGRAKSNVYYLYNCRNRLRFAARNLPRREVLRWLLRTPQESWQILMRGGRRQLLHSPGPLTAAVAGTFRGVGAAVVACLRRPRGRATSDASAATSDASAATSGPSGDGPRA